MSSSLLENPLSAALSDKKSILIAGAGGGFDIYSGIPLYLALRAQGKKVHLANLSFSFLHPMVAEEAYPNCFKILGKWEEDRPVLDYFPERHLAEWLSSQFQEEIPVYAFPKTGVIPLQNAYQYLVGSLDLDAIILIDGGTDSLMFGNEAGLGTPSEDYASMAAVDALSLENESKFLVCLGFGVDHFHGVSHYDVLKNISSLSKEGYYKGCFSVLMQHQEGISFIDLVEFVNRRMSSSQSIVSNSVASAIEGNFGNHHKTNRTRSSELFINPLMNIYWVFALEGIALNNPLLKVLRNTKNFEEIPFLIETYRHSGIEIGRRKNIPL